MEKTYTVYRLISPNTKMYVGITCQRLLCQRWRNGTGYPHNVMLQSDIQKYGWDNIQHELLDQTNDRECASDLEQRYIAEYDSKNPDKGYNTCLGGLGLMHGEIVNPSELDYWDL